MKIKSNTRILYLLMMTGLLVASCSGEQDETIQRDNPVSVVLSSPQQAAGSGIQASGQIEAKETAVISTRVMGFVSGVHVKAGDVVRKGQLLITINSADIQARRAQAEAMVTEAEAALKDAKRDYDRFNELYQQQSASEKEFENAALHYESVKAKAEAARQMKNEAEAMLTYTNIKAPFDGVVAQQNADAGSMANPGMPLVVIEQQGNFQVSASVTEADIAHVQVGSNATVIVKSTGKVFSGKVREVSPSSQFSGGQYLVKVDVPAADKNDLYSGMYVNLTIESKQKATEQNVMVPSSAIIYKDQLSGLYTISEHQTALLRWVKLGKTYGDQVEVLSGLRADESFIVSAEGKLYNGAPVVVK